MTIHESENTEVTRELLLLAANVLRRHPEEIEEATLTEIIQSNCAVANATTSMGVLGGCVSILSVVSGIGSVTSNLKNFPGHCCTKCCPPCARLLT